jgi:hypothetical protein
MNSIAGWFIKGINQLSMLYYSNDFSTPIGFRLVKLFRIRFLWGMQSIFKPLVIKQECLPQGHKIFGCNLVNWCPRGKNFS